MLQLLQSILRLPQMDPIWLTEKPPPRDPLLISIDCEGGVNTPIHEIGVSVLDTRYLRKLSFTASTISDYQRAITTYNYSLRGPSKATARKPKSYLFDKWARASKPEFRGILDDIMGNGIETKPEREIMMVGHEFPTDYESMAREDLHRAIPDVSILDTHVISRRVYLKEKRARNIDLSLGGLCTELKIPQYPEILHNGGNDSHLTLRVLLLLALRSVLYVDLSASDRDICSVLRAVARSPLLRDTPYEDTLFEKTMEAEYAQKEFNVPLGAKQNLPKGNTFTSKSTIPLEMRKED